MCRPGPGGLARHRLRGAGLPEALPACAGLHHRPGPSHTAAADGAAGQGRLLGQRNQARAGGRAGGLPRVHPQGAHRRELPGLRPQAAGRARGGVPAVRHAQRAHAGRHLPPGRAELLRWPVRIPVPARHGRAAVQPGGGPARRGRPGPALPHLRAGGHARNPAGLPGAPAAGKRRQQLLRQPHRRRSRAHRAAGGRPGGRGGRRRAGRRPGRPAASGHCAAACAVRGRAGQQQRHRSVERAPAGLAGRRAAAPGRRLAGAAADRRPAPHRGHAAAGDQPGRPPRRGGPGDRGHRRRRGRCGGGRRGRRPGLGRHASRRPRRAAGARRRHAGSADAAAAGPDRARGRQDPAQRHWRGARGGGLSALLRGPGPARAD